MEKFSLRNQQAVVLRLIKDPFLLEKFAEYLRPEDFTLGQQDLQKQALGRLVEVIRSYLKEKHADRLNVDSMRADGGRIDGNRFECTTCFDYGYYDLLNAVNLSQMAQSIKGN